MNPPVHQQFRQQYQRRDQQGGGAELQCSYNIFIKKNCFSTAMHVLEDMVPMQELDARLFA